MLISSVLRFVSNFDRYARSRSGLFTRPSTGYVNLCFPSCHVNTRRYKLLYYDNCLEKAEIYIYIFHTSRFIIKIIILLFRIVLFQNSLRRDSA